MQDKGLFSDNIISDSYLLVMADTDNLTFLYFKMKLPTSISECVDAAFVKSM